MTKAAPANQWPEWARTWYGYGLRILVAVWGISGGFYLVLVGYFTAVDWKTGESDWTTGAAMLVLAGTALALYCLIGAIRPTRLLFMPPLILFAIGSPLLIVFATLGRNL